MRTRTKVIFILVALVVVVAALRIFLVRPFHVAAGSMRPTMAVGELFLAVTWYPQPQRGDIVVFRYAPGDADFVSRIVGMPGERIQMINGQLHINGEPVKHERIEDYQEAEDGKSLSVKQWRETLPNGVTHRTLDLIDNSFFDNTQEYAVPAGHYFMMGDNRDNSADSRMKSRTVPRENLVGRIFYCSRNSCR